MPKRRILPFILLGIINNHPGITGREITDEFSNEIGDFWKASHSQVYPELRRMIDDGWVKTVLRKVNAKEKYYELTEAGKVVLNDWLGQTVEELPIHQDLFSLKLFFINDPKDTRIQQLVTNQVQLLKKDLHHLKKRLALVFPDEQAINRHYGHYLILKRAISRTAGQLAWLQQYL